MTTTNPIRILLLLCCLLLSAPALAAALDKPLPGDSVYQLPAVLIDQDGKGFDWRSRRGEPQLVTMFYTSCPYMCPLIVDAGKSIEKALTPEQLGGLHLLFISMDPTNDTRTRCALSQIGGRRFQPHRRTDPARPRRSHRCANRENWQQSRP